MSWFIAITLLFACLGLLARLGVHEAEQRFPPVVDFAQIEGIRLHYTDAGSGPAVVLVHGASTSLLDFHASIADHLSRGNRVIAVDRPGRVSNSSMSAHGVESTLAKLRLHAEIRRAAAGSLEQRVAQSESS